ncbi:MAG: hypothetical protein A2001_01590 [Treponema sp. GWC1_61_84]|nr:MAG: hypothetical protein A2001_01590 [Treponema sp. GWC1_61_84]
MIQQTYAFYSDLRGLEHLTFSIIDKTITEASPEFRSALGEFRGAIVSEYTRVGSVVENEVNMKLLAKGATR